MCSPGRFAEVTERMYGDTEQFALGVQASRDLELFRCVPSWGSYRRRAVHAE